MFVRRQDTCSVILWYLICDGCEPFLCVRKFLIRVWVGYLVLSDVCETSCVCVCVCVCVFGSVTLTLNPTLISPLPLTTKAFEPQSKEELEDAIEKCFKYVFLEHRDENPLQIP